MNDLHKIVKPLEWSGNAGYPHVSVPTAYKVTRRADGMVYVAASGWDGGLHEDAESARDAAQEDYEKRCLAAIDTDAVQDLINTAVARAWVEAAEFAESLRRSDLATGAEIDMSADDVRQTLGAAFRAMAVKRAAEREAQKNPIIQAYRAAIMGATE
jgi:hypothetical protein